MGIGRVLNQIWNSQQTHSQAPHLKRKKKVDSIYNKTKNNILLFNSSLCNTATTRMVSKRNTTYRKSTKTKDDYSIMKRCILQTKTLPAGCHVFVSPKNFLTVSVCYESRGATEKISSTLPSSSELKLCVSLRVTEIIVDVTNKKDSGLLCLILSLSQGVIVHIMYNNLLDSKIVYSFF